MTDPKVEAYMTAVADAFTEGKAEVKDALRLIAEHFRKNRDAQAVQLLALRRYLRLGGMKVHANWAWTAEQAERFLKAGTGKLLADEAGKVQKNFAASNPGYSLRVSPLRSLTRQVRLWNGNNSVQKAGDRLLKELIEELKNEESYPAAPTGVSTSIFELVLRRSAVTPEPTSAAPGTSDHGQMRAVNFVVVRGQAIVADIQSSTIQTIWKEGGWKEKLIAATKGTKLVGPLKHPYEPWHWTVGSR